MERNPFHSSLLPDKVGEMHNMTANLPIGGYFELELPTFNNFPQSNGKFLNSGHHALEYILRLSKNIEKVYLPYYTCTIVLHPIRKLGLKYEFYRIDKNLEIQDEINLGENDLLIYTNYFGIKDQYAKKLAKKYGRRILIDNAQALFAERIKGIMTIYSPRKYVGIPDGGIAYSENNIRISDDDTSYDRCAHLLKRYDLGANGGYEDFHINSEKLHEIEISNMSSLTRAILGGIDFEFVRMKRWSNFKKLHEAIGDANKLQIPDFSTFACPMVYPYLTETEGLKKYLISNMVFVATYWPNVFEWCKPEHLEYQLAEKCLAIPIDQRYGEEEMKYIIKTIKMYGM